MLPWRVELSWGGGEEEEQREYECVERVFFSGHKVDDR